MALDHSQRAEGSPSSPSYPLGVLATVLRDIRDALLFAGLATYIVIRLFFLLVTGNLDPNISLFRLLRSGFRSSRQPMHRARSTQTDL